MAGLPQDTFAVKGNEAQEPACVLRLQRRGWPVGAIARTLGKPAPVISRYIREAIEDERRRF
jgi:hypothetical protein